MSIIRRSKIRSKKNTRFRQIDSLFGRTRRVGDKGWRRLDDTYSTPKATKRRRAR